MKLALKLSLFLFPMLTFADKSLSLTDSQIKRICKKETRELNCFKNLREKRSKLKEGNFIEIPVIPYKK